jgi:O-succinylbenzoate synthase
VQDHHIKQGGWGRPGSRRVHDIARAASVPVWCGGMPRDRDRSRAEPGTGGDAGFTLPATPARPRRSFLDDLTGAVRDGADGTMAVPAGPSRGHASDRPAGGVHAAVRDTSGLISPGLFEQRAAKDDDTRTLTLPPS